MSLGIPANSFTLDTLLCIVRSNLDPVPKEGLQLFPNRHSFFGIAHRRTSTCKRRNNALNNTSKLRIEEHLHDIFMYMYG